MARGRQDLSVVRFELSAPVAIGGETPFRDPALVDRTVHVKLERAEKNPAALAALLALPLGAFAAGMYRYASTLLLDVAQWERAAKLLPAAFVDVAHERQRLAWQTVAFGLLLLEPFLAGVHGLIAQFADYRQAPDEDVVKPTMAVVYEAVRVMGELMKAHRMRANQDFCIKDGALWFIPGTVLPMIEEYFQRVDTDLPMGREAILGRMREDSKGMMPMVMEYQKTFRMNQKVAKGVAISLDKVEQEMGIPTSYWTQMAMEESVP